MKSLVMALTYSRIISSTLLLFMAPFSTGFFIVYTYCGISDMVDGWLARKTQTVTEKGAFLDSIADAVFLAVVLYTLVSRLLLPRWLLWAVVVIAGIRCCSYCIGYIKYRAFASLHTWLNKGTGLLLFSSPILYLLMGVSWTGGLVIAVAIISAVEELVITLTSETLDRNRRSLLF